MTPMRFLVLGGTSFIGPHILRELTTLGHSLTIFHRGKTLADLPPGIAVVRGDRHQLGQHITELRATKPDVVIDMIAFTRHDAQDLVEVFSGYAARTVVASSCDVYRNFGGLIGIESAEPETTPLTESSPLRNKRYPYRPQAKNPSDWVYEYEKLDVEEVVTSTPALPGTIIRLPMVYGEGDRQRRLSTYLKPLAANEPIVLSATHAAWRTHRGYAQNMAHAIVLAATNPVAAGQIYNAADATSLTEADFARAVLTAANSDAEVKILPDDQIPADKRYPGDPHYPLEIDTSKIRSHLAYTDLVSLPDSLRKTAAWEQSTLGQA